MITDVQLIGVPFDGYGRPGNHARAPAALRAAGLSEVFAKVVADDDISLPAPEFERGPNGLVNEAAVVAMTDALNEKVGASVGAGRFPLVFGGDCSMLLGIVTSLRDQVGDVGLVFVDGHEDTMPLDVSEDGEAANAEIGLLLGLTGRLLRGPLANRLPALDKEDLAVIGVRDEQWRKQFNVGTLADYGVWLSPLPEAADDPARVGRRAISALNTSVQRWWLHIDLDVLDPLEFPAQGLPDIADEPGGLTWTQLTDLASSMMNAGGCVGASLAIYDPDQDTDGRDATRIVKFVRDVLSDRQ